MKNTILFLTSIFVVLFISNLEGQSDNLPSKNQGANQANLSSIEMMNLVKMVMEEPGLILDEIIPYLPDDVETVNLEITFEYQMVVSNDMTSRYWNEYVANTEVASDFFASNNYVKEFSRLLNTSLPSSRIFEDPFFEKYKMKEFIDKSQTSLMHSTDNSFQVKLDLDTTMRDIGLMNKVKTSSIGNWDFVVGPGEGFDF